MKLQYFFIIFKNTYQKEFESGRVAFGASVFFYTLGSADV